MTSHNIFCSLPLYVSAYVCLTHSMSTFFGLVVAVDETRELGGTVAVVVRGTEGVILDTPARRENSKIL